MTGLEWWLAATAGIAVIGWACAAFFGFGWARVSRELADYEDSHEHAWVPVQATPLKPAEFGGEARTGILWRCQFCPSVYANSILGDWLLEDVRARPITVLEWEAGGRPDRPPPFDYTEAGDDLVDPAEVVITAEDLAAARYAAQADAVDGDGDELPPPEPEQEPEQKPRQRRRGRTAPEGNHEQ